MQINFNINIDDRIVSFFKRKATKRNSIAAITVLILLIGIITISAQSLEWTNFQPGDPVSSSALNAKLNDLRGRSVPAGSITAFAGNFNHIPDGWLVCNGKAYDKTEYPDLYAAIRNAWGGTSTGATFNVPDFRGVFLRGIDGDPERGKRGLDNDPDRSGDNATLTGMWNYQNDAMQRITGSSVAGIVTTNGTSDPSDYSDSSTGALYWDNTAQDRESSDGSTKFRGRIRFDSHESKSPVEAKTDDYETRPKNYAVIYLIKY